MDGVLILDKPAGMTSHDVVHRVRRILGERSVGHLGTLDPMATGVLPLVLGRMTRLAQFYTGSEKTYEGEFLFGFATDTYDAAGDVMGPVRDPVLDLEQVRAAARHYQGSIQQMPPPFSAKKIAGVPAYRLARQKKPVALQPVTVEVKELEVESLEGGRARFRARVAAGTYLRSVAHDLGQDLGCGGHLAVLRRTSVGEFGISEACTLEQVEGAAESGTAAALLVHPRRLLPQFPAVTATEECAALIRHGRAVNLPELSRARQVKVFQGQGELIAIATRVAGTLFHPRIVFSRE
ncbi:MAG: tRNA pseudouridine(55) synthase TruB [Terriglobales bacterium]